MWTLVEKKQDISHHESVLFHPVLKAYPTDHSWIITVYISLGDLNRQLCMFNCQKTLAHQLQGKLLASHLVLNALLDEFSNIDSIMNPTSQPYNQQYSCSKLSQKTCHHLKTHDLKKPITRLRGCTKMANRHSYHKRYMGNQATCKPTDTCTDQATGDSSPCHIYPKCHRICS